MDGTPMSIGTRFVIETLSVDKNGANILKKVLIAIISEP